MARTLRAVLLTPPGRGAVATVLVAGQSAVEIVGRLFRPANGGPLASFPLGRIVLGRFGDEPSEELVVVCRAADHVELHCHGGRAAVEAVLEALTRAGCTQMSWQAWSRAEAQDTIQAEALEALAQARTRQTAAILLDQYSGALSEAIASIVSGISSPDDERRQAARANLQRLAAHAALGRHLTAPFQVVLAGRPNVGKSSLMNALVGYCRAIVCDEPGTTRDVVTAATAVSGWAIELADTAGLRRGEHPVEAAGVELACQRMAQADLVVLVFDASRPWSNDDDALAADWPAALVVHTKSDLPPDTTRPRPAGVRASSVTVGGADELAGAIAARLVPEIPPPGAAVPFNERQGKALGRALALVSAGDFSSAAETLRATGR